jgi:hypothetical protein
MYSVAPPSCNSCYVCIVMRIPSVGPIWAAFLCGYLLLPYFLPTKNAERHAVLSWYMYSVAPPSCNSCYSHAHTYRCASQ